MVDDERLTVGSAGAQPDGESSPLARADARDAGPEYACRVTWTGNLGTGTSAYDAYSRSHDIAVDGKPPVRGSADRAYRGDPGLHNPEDLLVAAVSACHMLTYLALCARNGVAVLGYDDRAQGRLTTRRGQPAFGEILLSPTVTLADAAHEALARTLHEAAREKCIIANSCSMPIRHAVDIRIAGGQQHD